MHVILAIALVVSLSSFSSLAAPPAYVEKIETEAGFDALGTNPGGVVRTGKVIKFLIDNRAYPKGKVYFINGNYCEGRECPARWTKLHYDFAAKKLPKFSHDKRTFDNAVYYENDLKAKTFIAGRVQTFEIGEGQDRRKFYGVWFFERDVIHEESVQYAVDLVAKAIQIPRASIGFVQYGQQQSVERVRSWFNRRGYGIYTVDQVMANIETLPLNPGEAFGYLRVFPADPDDLEPTEIPVFDQLPLDLAVVAGTISTAFQDVGSHVNLKSKERGTPNVVLRKKEDIERLRTLDGRPVRLRVSKIGYSIEETTADLVQRSYEARVNRPWQHPSQDLTGEALSFDRMCRERSTNRCLRLGTRFGGKASRLGFMAHQSVIGEGSETQKKFGYRLTPVGFGAPLRFYQEFVAYNYARNPEFKKDLELLINSETSESGFSPLPTPEKKELIARVQSHFLNAQFPPALYASLEASVKEMKAEVARAYPGEDLNKLKIRSSANVEDIDGFNGAGLHDSYSASIKKSSFDTANGPCVLVPDNDNEADGETKMDVKPKSLGCAIKAVYGSLWNLRAVRERSYRRFHHRSATMGLAVMPAYKFREATTPKPEIAANSVLLTRVLNADAVYGFQISSQLNNGLVTNPAPGTQAELATMVFQLRSEPAVTILRYAKPSPASDPLKNSVMPHEVMRKMVYVARKIEEAYCAADSSYFPDRNCREVSNSAKKPKALDMETKYFTNGELLFKQFRTFSGK